MESRVDFIQEMLKESEIAEEQKRIDMDRLRADAMLGAVAVIEQQMEQVNQLAVQEIQLVEEYRSTEITRLDKKRSWLLLNLEQFMRSTNKNTVRLPHGILKLRKGRDRIAFSAMEKFLAIGQKLGLVRKVPESVLPNNQAILEYIRRTGEIPTGIEFIPAEINFSYATTGANNGKDEREEAEG